ncbi:MAG: peptide deformylase [Deltaproteobacteria bacterium]|nr:peptide deformylase [Deltaproteobacteria bacterium]
MALRRILKFPETQLKETAADVANIDAVVDAALQDMAETMYAAPGIGLAAPQVGLGQRMIVVDVNTEEPGKQLLKLINPVIAERYGEILWEEGCLSVVDYTAEVKRSAQILLRAWTPEQKEVAIEADGLLAVCLQHELDHLDGKLFIDRISALKRDSYRRKIRRLLRDGIDLDSYARRKASEDRERADERE